jgi:HlyD family secretion protein
VTEKKIGVMSEPIAAVTTRGADDAISTDAKQDKAAPAETTQEPKPTKKDKPKEVVFIHDKDKAKIREVKTGITDTAAGTIEVISGLKEGEEIVSGPFIAVSKKLKDGEVITKKIEKKEDKDKKKE